MTSVLTLLQDTSQLKQTLVESLMMRGLLEEMSRLCGLRGLQISAGSVGVDVQLRDRRPLCPKGRDHRIRPE